MPKIRPLGEISKKYATVTPGRTGEYESGVQNPRVDWKTATLNAVAAHTAGVQQAIQQQRFQRGVTGSSTQDWQDGSVNKGAQRYGPGVALAQPDYEAGFGPYHQVIANTTLPPRGARGAPNNIQRVAVLAAALNKKKIGAA
jgi:hypothetical protein